MQSVYRYKTTGIAKRVFDNQYVPSSASLDKVEEWTYQSTLAEQSQFGCGFTAGNERVVCEWAARYEEFIVVFRADKEPPQLTLEDMELIVEVIDERMAQSLGESTTSSE